MNDRAQELWRLIRFGKATVEELRLWCKELNKILSQPETKELTSTPTPMVE